MNSNRTKETSIKIMCLISHMEATLDLIEELQFNDSVYKHKFKKLLIAVSKEAETILKPIIYNNAGFKGKTHEETQKKHYLLLARIQEYIKQMNIDIIEQLSEPVKENIEK